MHLLALDLTAYCPLELMAAVLYFPPLQSLSVLFRIVQSTLYKWTWCPRRLERDLCLCANFFISGWSPGQ